MCLSMLRRAWEDNLHNPVAWVKAELQGESVGVKMTPVWLLLLPAGGRIQNQNLIAQGSPDERLRSAELMNWSLEKKHC